MSKRFIVALLIIASLASVSLGKVKDLDDFTVDVPIGWEVSKQNNGLYFIGTTDGSKGIFFGGYKLKDGLSLEDAAKAFSKELHGTKPVYSEEYSGYKFKFRFTSERDVIFNAVVIDSGNNTFATVLWANVSKSVLGKILGSIKAK